MGPINYAPAKAALLGMASSASKELAQANIIVNAIASRHVHADDRDDPHRRVLQANLLGLDPR